MVTSGSWAEAMGWVWHYAQVKRTTFRSWGEETRSFLASARNRLAAASPLTTDASAT